MAGNLSGGLPSDLNAERLILGSVILDHIRHAEIFSQLDADDFTTEAHRRIYARLQEMDAAGDQIDRVTIASRLNDLNLLESVGGLTYLTSLDTGLPEMPSIEAYIDIVREKASLRKIIFAAQHLMNRCLSSDSDSAELIALADQTLMQIGYKSEKTAEVMLPAEVVEDRGGLDKFLNPDEGVRTPWIKFSEITGGYRRGELFVLAGNPGMGKSAAALQVAMRVAEDGHGAMIFSLEMSRESLVRRMLSYRARVDGAKWRAGYLNKDERGRILKAFAEIAKWPLGIAEHGISTVSAIRAALRKHRTKHDIFMVVIDYLQLLQSIGRPENRNAEVSAITRALKLLAIDEKVNIQLLSQCNRDNKKERRPPELQDLRESGSIEQDADAVAFVWRPEMMWRDREDIKGIAELILAKQRNGPTGKINLSWLGNFTAFENFAEDTE